MMWKLYLGFLLADMPVFLWDKQTGAIGVLMILLVVFLISLHQSTR
jgi:hypothetical protein